MDKKIDGMIVATFLTTIFYSSTYPYINKVVVSSCSDNIIAVNQMINCLSIVVFGYLWNKKSDKLFKLYPVLCISETILGMCTTLYVTTTNNIVSYYILDTLLFAVITRNICCGGIKLRALRYRSEKSRELFDNNNNSASAVATIIGSLMAMVLDINLSKMIWVSTLGNAIDNIFYIAIYYKTSKKTQLLEKDN